MAIQDADFIFRELTKHERKCLKHVVLGAVAKMAILVALHHFVDARFHVLVCVVAVELNNCAVSRQRNKAPETNRCIGAN